MIFDRLPYAQQIFAEYLADIRFAVASLQQAVDQVRILDTSLSPVGKESPTPSKSEPMPT